MSGIPPPTAESIRDLLKSRCGEHVPVGTWRVAATAAGVSDADAFLCHLSRSVTAALECLVASAEDSRTRVQSAREIAHDVHKPHYDELVALITSTESAKRTALERELCAVDAVLELLRAERSAVIEVAASMPDADLVAQHSEWAARLDAAEARLLALPTSVVEPPHVGVVVGEPPLLVGGTAVGRIVAPLAITAADLSLVATQSHACTGSSLRLHAQLQSALLCSQSAEELDVSLVAAASATHVDAALESEGVAPQPLQVDVTADVPGRCISISIGVPATAPIGSWVRFGPVTVSGQPVAGLLGALRVEPPGPADLSPEHASQLQAWLPPGGSSSPGMWKEMYRATTHGFGAAAFHERCDGQARLLLLVRAREGGWLFGGFTFEGLGRTAAAGYGYFADPAAFLFSLTNSLGRPEKLESKRTGMDLFHHPFASLSFGAIPSDLFICNNADTKANSYTNTGNAYAESASAAAHPLARGEQKGWLAAEVVAWAV